MGDIVAEVPDIASAYRCRMKVADISSERELAIFNQIKADIEAAGIMPGTKLASLSVQLDEPSLEDTMPDNERLVWKLQQLTGADKVVSCYEALRKLARVLRENGFRARCIVESGEVLTVLDVLAPPMIPAQWLAWLSILAQPPWLPCL